MLKPQLIDMIRSVPEVAVRLWCGGVAVPSDDGVRINYEDRSIVVSQEVYDQGLNVSKILSIRWGSRMLRTVQDVLELRHAAEDVLLDVLFEKQDTPSVLFVPAGKTASGYYRAMIPAELAYEGGKVVSHWTASVDLSKVLRYKVLWIQLITSHILVEIVRQAKSQGVKVVYDIDDRLDSIPEGNQAGAVYGTPEKQAEIVAMLKMADLVTASTEPLARHLRECGVENVRVVRNQMTANVAPRRHPPNRAFTRILWAGSPTHKHDLAIVAPAIRNILKRHAGKVRFTCMGERLPVALADCYDYVDLVEPVDFAEYHDKIASIAADFGIAPLQVNPFNDSKSAIKALEYASAGYPMLLSPVGEYPHIVEGGFPAELVADDQWEEAIERMIAMPHEAREELGRRCTDWVIRNRCIGTSRASQWADIVTELLKEGPKPEESKLRLLK
jgi:glycosyltransferase involved in cell wall biosynthesis